VQIQISFSTFLFITIFVVSLGTILFELTLTRIFSIVLWYDYAFMAISVAFFGLGIGAITVYVFNTKTKTQEKCKEHDESFVSLRIIQHTVTFAISIPIFLFIVGYIIPPSTNFIYLFYITSSIPFFFAGMSLALMYVAMPREISKLYFVDLGGAAAATLVLDPMMQNLGAEATLLSLAVIIGGTSVVSVLLLFKTIHRRGKSAIQQRSVGRFGNNTKLYAILVLGGTSILTIAYIFGYTSILSVEPGENKSLNERLADPSIQYMPPIWNSFSRIDVTQNSTMKYDDDPNKKNVLASILIDADADTPVYNWNGSVSDLQWIKNYMDFLPYEISDGRPINNTLIIGSGGGGDILVALAGGSKKVTAVELNPSIITAVKKFGKSAGNMYNHKDVILFIDDGRRFITSSNSKFDMIVIKLVDSWAAQLAGGYALSENYLYTVEAFREYLQHLNQDNGMLVMVRWNIELPRLLPLVGESLRKEETANSIQQISRQILVVEDRLGLYFGSNPERTFFPVLVMIKNSPFTDSEISIANEKVAKNDAKVIAMPGQYIHPPYDRLLFKNYGRDGSLQNITLNNDDTSFTPNLQESGSGLNIPTDDSPFYFAKERVPKQMIMLLETILVLAAVITAMLIYYSRINKIRSNGNTRFLILFVIFIGIGFMFLEITFIQKFLLLLGTPIMALTVILFSILLSTGVGSYLSGRLFDKKPYTAITVSIPVLVGIVLFYYYFLQEIITAAISLQLSQRIALTLALLSPVGIFMGFQFPSIIKMAYPFGSADEKRLNYNGYSSKIITLLLGVNVIASVVGTVLAAISSMTLGFGGNLLIAVGSYLAALCSATLLVKQEMKITSR
jgi:predicted membrane-bound spermidine synthase